MSTPKLPPEFVKLCKAVTAKRPKTVIDHILKHGFITTQDLKDRYGYNQVRRWARCWMLGARGGGSRCENLHLGRGVGEVSWIECDNAFGAFATSEGRVKRIVNAAAHDASRSGFPEGRLIIRQQQRFDCQTRLEPQH